MADETKPTETGSGNEVKPQVTVVFGKGPVMRPTLKLTPPEGGWCVAKHQKESKKVGKTKY